MTRFPLLREVGPKKKKPFLYNSAYSLAFILWGIISAVKNPFPVSFKDHSSYKGFSLIETMVSVGVLLLIGGGVIAFQRSILSSTRVLESSLLTQRNVRKALLVFVNEVRTATPSVAGAYPIEGTGTSSFVFFANIDGNPGAERIRYFMAGNALKKGVIKPSGTSYPSGSEELNTVATDVRNSSTTPIFLYYDKNYDGVGTSTALASPTNIPDVRLVQLSLTIDPNASRAPVSQTYRTQVTLRNLKDNL